MVVCQGLAQLQAERDSGRLIPTLKPGLKTCGLRHAYVGRFVCLNPRQASWYRGSEGDRDAVLSGKDGPGLV